MPVEGIESLLENPAMVEAISTVFERTEGGNEELNWEDVSDSLSSEQWGRLISEGVLVSTGGGFVIANPEALEKELNKHQSQGGTEAHEGAIGSVSWEWHDKVAAVAAICLFVGYWNTDVREVVASVDNIILAPIAEVLPFYAVIMLLSVVTGFYSTVLQSRLTESEKIQAYKDRMEGLKERKKAAKERGDEEALDRIREEQMEAAGDQLSLLKLQFRPTVWIMLMTIPVFLWLRWKIRGGHLGIENTGLVLPIVGHTSWQTSLFGPMPTWIVWYFLCSMGARQIIQKFLGYQGPQSS